MAISFFIHLKLISPNNSFFREAVNGSGKALSKEELDAYKVDLETLKAEYNLKEPV